jgi:hypothetical protein
VQRPGFHPQYRKKGKEGKKEKFQILVPKNKTKPPLWDSVGSELGAGIIPSWRRSGRDGKEFSGTG